jgi:hypothetical protein
MNLFPQNTLTLAIACTATSSTSQALPALGKTVRLVNEGPNNCYVSIGSGAQTATLPPTSTPTTTCTPVLAGTDIVLYIPNEGAPGYLTPLNIAAVCRTGQTATLIVQCGEGQ